MSERIAVVIPLYNQGSLVGRAVRSVLCQLEPVDEILVVNDGSTDAGPEQVRAIHDARVRVVDQPNAGVSAARNRGVREAGSELICFLDADDEYLRHFTAEIRELRAAFPDCGLYATAYEREFGERKVEVGAGGERTELVEGFPQMAIRSLACSSAACVPKTLFEEVGGFPEDVSLGEDLECWARIMLRKPCAYSSKVSAIYHGNPESATKSEPLLAGEPPFARAYDAYRAEHPAYRDERFEELIALAKLSGFTIGNWLSGRREAVQAALEESRRFPRCRKTRLALRFVTLLPKPLGFALFRFFESLKGRTVGHKIKEPWRTR